MCTCVHVFVSLLWKWEQLFRNSRIHQLYIWDIFRWNAILGQSTYQCRTVCPRFTFCFRNQVYKNKKNWNWSRIKKSNLQIKENLTTKEFRSIFRTIQPQWRRVNFKNFDYFHPQYCYYREYSYKKRVLLLLHWDVMWDVPSQWQTVWSTKILLPILFRGRVLPLQAGCVKKTQTTFKALINCLKHC